MPDLTLDDCDEFTRSYVNTLYWLLTGQGGDNHNFSPDFEISDDDLSQDTIKEILEDCTDFVQSFGVYFEGEEDRAGHDFALTRNGHGAGFWDGDWEGIYQRLREEDPTSDRYDSLGDFLSDMSKPYGTFELECEGKGEPVYHHS